MTFALVRSATSVCHDSPDVATVRSAGQSLRCTSVTFPATSRVVSATSSSRCRIAKISIARGCDHHDVDNASPVTSPTTLVSDLSCCSSRPWRSSSASTRCTTRYAGGGGATGMRAAAAVCAGGYCPLTRTRPLSS